MNSFWDWWFDAAVLGFLRYWYTPNFIIGNADNMMEAFMCTPKK